MLKDIYSTRINSNLTTANIKQLENKIGAYVDSNSEILLTLDFSRRFSFADSDRAVLYDVVGISEQEFTTSIRQEKAIPKNNKIQSNPFYLLTILTTKAFLDKKDEPHALLVLQYMALNMYVSAHKGTFKYNATKQIMDYTIAHLESSFIIGKMNSIYEFLMDNTKTVLNTYRDRILSGTDRDLTYVTDAMWTRIKQKIIRLGRVYYKNHESGNYLNSDVDSYTDEEFHEADNDSFVADRLTNKVYIKLINRRYDTRLIKYAITSSDVTYQRIKNLMDDIVDSDQNNEIRTVISRLIEYYLVTSGNSADSIARGDFIVHMKSSFMSNRSGEQISYAKDRIDAWVKENMAKHGQYSYGKSKAAVYRKTVYMFLIYLINAEAKAR